MNWQDLKKYVYHEDGSLRDVYIRNSGIDDWKRWIEFVNSKYNLSFEIGDKIASNRISFDPVTKFWNDPKSERPKARIYLGHITVHSYFFGVDEIDNDIDPSEIQTLKDHELIVAYLMAISKALGKPVELTEENCSNSKQVLLLIDGDKINFPDILHL